MDTFDVLLVEDNEADAQLVVDALAFARAPRFRIARAARLGDACRQLRSRSVDVVLLDLGLPDGNGLESLSTVRAAAPLVAVVVLSGLGDERLALSAVQSGAQDYLVKRDWDGDALRRSIVYAMARRDADQAQRRLAAIVESSPDAIVAEDREGRVVTWNPGAERLYGYSVEEVLGRTTGMLLPAGRAIEHEAILERVLAGRHVGTYETQRLRSDGAMVEVSLTVSPIVDVTGMVTGVASIARDISERKRLERELRHRADHDHLTGLLSRRRFEQELGHHLALTRRYGPGGALLSLDLDGFKAVNDRLGHAAGDDLLRSVARVLTQRLRATDVVGRLGGDELAILLPHARREDVGAVASSVLDAVRGCIVSAGEGSAAITASIGVALFGAGADSADAVLARADRAMYAAKQGGGDQVSFSEPRRAGSR